MKLPAPVLLLLIACHLQVAVPLEAQTTLPPARTAANSGRHSKEDIAEIQAWIGQFQQRVKQFWEPPDIREVIVPRLDDVIISMKIKEDGNIQGYYVAQRSGLGSVDEAAVVSILKYRTVGPLPQAFNEGIDLEFSFNINRSPIDTTSRDKSRDAAQLLSLKYCSLGPKKVEWQAEEILASYPNSAAERLLLRALIHQDKLDDLDRRAEIFVARHPYSWSLQIKRAEVYYAKKQYQEAWEAMGKMQEPGEQQEAVYGYEYYNLKGDILFEMGRQIEAIGAWSRAATLATKDAHKKQLELLMDYVAGKPVNPELKKHFKPYKNRRDPDCAEPGSPVESFDGDKIRTLLKEIAAKFN